MNTQVISDYRLGTNNRGEIVIPFYNEDNNLTLIKFRSMMVLYFIENEKKMMEATLIMNVKVIVSLVVNQYFLVQILQLIMKSLYMYVMVTMMQ